MAKKIFIIEDDANILYALQAKFRVEGFDVLIDNGTGEREEILNKVRAFSPDFVIMDLVLPKMDGKDLLREIKMDKNISSHPHVFVFSDFSEADNETRREKTGADYFLTKNNFVVDNFVESVKRIIRNKERIEN